MTERRATITLNWRPAGEPARRIDDFAQVPYEPPHPTRATDAANLPPAHGREIEPRLENWARWATSGEGPTAAACMTGAICETLRKAAQGITSTVDPTGRGIDTHDAVLIGRAMVRIGLDHRRLLGLFYVDRERKGYIAALMRFPPLEFDRRMIEAQEAIEAALSKSYQNSNSQ